MRQPFRRGANGTVKNRLSPSDREIIAQIFEDMATVCMGDRQLLWRLFPPRYDDPARQAGFELESAGSHDSQVELAATFAACRSMLITADVLEVDQADELLRGMNKARLALGSIVNVEDEDFDLPPDADEGVKVAYNVYVYLGWLVSALIDQLSA